jgi:DNA-binding response OmpR family regulator
MRILVVEDEHLIANSIKKGLEQERHAVDVAYDGTSGYDLAATEDYDLLILDLMLPGMDGLAICRQLRQEGNHIPILILTAKSQLPDKVGGLDAGADDYLTKPFSFEELLARIRALSRRPPSMVSQTLVVGNLTMEPRSFEVSRGGKKIQLSGKEFALLEYLMHHPNTIQTKEQIIGHVWDYDANILPNTVEVYIKNLRGKIDLPFGEQPPLIHTIRGFGYKIGE